MYVLRQAQDSSPRSLSIPNFVTMNRSQHRAAVPVEGSRAAPEHRPALQTRDGHKPLPRSLQLSGSPKDQAKPRTEHCIWDSLPARLDEAARCSGARL